MNKLLFETISEAIKNKTTSKPILNIPLKAIDDLSVKAYFSMYIYNEKKLTIQFYIDCKNIMESCFDDDDYNVNRIILNSSNYESNLDLFSQTFIDTVYEKTSALTKELVFNKYINKLISKEDNAKINNKITIMEKSDYNVEINKCLVCLDNMQHPTLQCCNQYLCLVCYDKLLLSKNKNNIKCPQCRAKLDNEILEQLEFIDNL